MRTTKSGRKIFSSRIVSLTLLVLCIVLFIACGENLLVIDFLDGKNSKPLPDVTVTAPTFAAVTEGYTQPAAQKIIITNDGKSKVTIKSVTVSPDTAFAISGGGSTVNKKSSIDTWTVQPKAALPRGERMAIITVTCSGTGGTAASSAVVTFAVTQPGAATLSVTAPTFTAQVEGYDPCPTAGDITVTNNGSSDATINSVTVSTGSFEITGSVVNTVNAGASGVTIRSVQPKLGLTHGTHMAIITVLYDGGTAASAAVTFVVTFVVTQAAVSRELTVTAPDFTEVYTRYTRTAALSIVITNTGNAAATIAATNGVTVSGSTITPTPNPVPDPLPTTFTIGAGSRVVSAGSSIANWSVRPKAGLPAGTYTAEITVTYDGTSGTGTATATVTFVVMARERFVAVASDSDMVAYSADGITWEKSTMPLSADWNSVTYGGGKYVAVAYGGSQAAYSFDGINWIAATLPATAYWTSVIYGNGIFVAVQSSGTPVCAYSTDGSTWKAATIPTPGNWTSVTYGYGIFLATSNGSSSNKAVYSTDGTDWKATPLSFASSDGWCVTYGNGKFFAVASGAGSSRVLYSPFGSSGFDSWGSAPYTPNPQNWRSVTYGKDKFLAVASDSSSYCYYSAPTGTYSMATLPSSAKWSSVTHGVVGVQ